MLKYSICVFALCTISMSKHCDKYTYDGNYDNRFSQIGIKKSFERNYWNSFVPPPLGNITFLRVFGLVPELCLYSLPTDVDEFIFINNGLSYVEPGILADSKAISVYIQDNNIHRILNGVFNGTGIVSLVLSYNKIETIESDAFNDMHNLEAINLDGNFISIWDLNWFRNSKVLYDFSMNGNLLEELPENACSFMRDRVEKGTYVALGSLSLYNNRIKVIHPDAFVGLSKFKTISLSNNLIEEINENVFKRLRVLGNLFLNTNNITCFTQGTIASFVGVDRLFLASNPLLDNCKTKIINFFQEKGDFVHL